jgi:hypothetical protein
MCFHGLTLALQSENSDSLKEIKRENMSLDQLKDAMAWGRSRELPIGTELIFGLPMETRKSFVSLIDRCIEMNFDNIHCYNLIVFDGIELNRPVARKKYAITTKYRHINGSCLILDDDFCAESEEVVGASGFGTDDFEFVRCIGLILYSVTYLKMHTFFFRYGRQLGIKFTLFCEKLFDIAVNSDESIDAASHLITNFRTAIDAELFDTREELVEYLRQKSAETGVVPESVKINAVFGKLLIQHSGDWVGKLLRRTLEELVDDCESDKVMELADFLLELGARERIAGDNLFEAVPLDTQFDVLAWRHDGYKTPLNNYRIPTKRITFTPSEELAKMRKILSEKLGPLRVQEELYEQMTHYNLSATDLLCEMRYECSDSN